MYAANMGFRVQMKINRQHVGEIMQKDTKYIQICSSQCGLTGDAKRYECYEWKTNRGIICLEHVN
jgi:hypothetical protein